jgi:hypothetical protein
VLVPLIIGCWSDESLRIVVVCRGELSLRKLEHSVFAAASCFCISSNIGGCCGENETLDVGAVGCFV